MEAVDSIRDDLELFRLEMQHKAAQKRAQADIRDIERRAARLKKQQEWRLQLKRAAHYLSMKPPISLPFDARDSHLGNSTLGDRESRVSEQSFPVLFVCVDVEAFEHDQNCITEIGISMLNTESLIGTTGGVRNINWEEKIVSKHFRIREYGHLRNKAFVKGCPADFQFGKSEWIREIDVLPAIQACFTAASPVSIDNSVKRVVFVAHNVEADIKYLKQLGLQPLTLVNDCLDTANLYQALRRQDNSTSLASTLLDLGIAAKYLHNAGNDARYTLQAMLVMVYEHTNNQKSASDWKDELEARVEIAIKETETRVRVDFQGWESPEDEELNLRSSIDKAKEKLEAIADDEQVSKGRLSQASTHARSRGNIYPYTQSRGRTQEFAFQSRPTLQAVNQGAFENSDRRRGVNYSRRPHGRGRRETPFHREDHQTGF
jgi:hypothetical protein